MANPNKMGMTGKQRLSRKSPLADGPLKDKRIADVLDKLQDGEITISEAEKMIRDICDNLNRA